MVGQGRGWVNPTTRPSVYPTIRPSAPTLEFPFMAEESNMMPASRIVRWLTLGALILFAVMLYFRGGLRLPAFGSTPVPPTPETAPASPPRAAQ